MCLGIPGRITDMSEESGILMGTVDFGGVRREVCLEYVAPDVAPGDYVTVHVGFALARIDEAEAQRTYQILREMSQLEELEWIREVADAAREERRPSTSRVTE